MLSFKSNRIKLNVKYWLAQLTALLWTENKANYYQTNVRLLLVEEMNLLSTISIVIGSRHVLPPISTPKNGNAWKTKTLLLKRFQPSPPTPRPVLSPATHSSNHRRRLSPATSLHPGFFLFFLFLNRRRLLSFLLMMSVFELLFMMIIHCWS